MPCLDAGTELTQAASARQPCSGHTGCSSAYNSRAVSPPGVKRAISGPAGNTGSSRRLAQGPGLQAVQQRHPLGPQKAQARGRWAPVHPSVKPAAGSVASRHACSWKGLLPECCAGGAGGTRSCPAGTAGMHLSRLALCPSAPASHLGSSPEFGCGAGRRSLRGAQQGAGATSLLCCAWCPGTSVQPQARLLLPPDGQPGPGCKPVTGLQCRLPPLLIKLHKYLIPNY